MNNFFLNLIVEIRQDTIFVGSDLKNLAKKRYPLKRLMKMLGDGEQITTGWRPCHLCHASGAMFRIFQPHGRWVFSCTGKCGKHGDQIDYLKAKFNLDDGEAIRLLSKFICP